MYETQVGNAAPWVALVTSELERCTQLGAGQAVLSLAGAAMDAVTAAGRPDDAEQIWAVCRDATVEFAPAALPRLALGAAGAALARDSRRDAAERLELGRRVAKSLNRHNDAAATESWLAALALSAGNARAAIRLAVTASATLEDCELAAYQYDLGVVWAAILSSTGHADAPTVAQLVEAGRPTVRRHEIESLLGECLVRSTDIATNETIDDVVTPLAEAIRVAMRGRRPRRAGRVGWESLTPAERTVVELAIDGLTNGSIARRLHVSAGTVKTHLAHVYTKLGVANRTELANVALRSRERLAHRSPD
jgi:DNA-binding CsgD family transcriptional regulator